MSVPRGDYCPENRDNIELIFNKLEIEKTLAEYPFFHIVADLKCTNIICGLGTHSSKFPCHLCEGHRVQGQEAAYDAQVEEGRWVQAQLRSYFSCLLQYNAYCDAKDQNKAEKSMNYKSQTRSPLAIHRDASLPFLYWVKMDPLHLILLGACPDTISALEQKFPEQTRKFLKDLGLKHERSGQPGLIFNGPQV